MVVSDHGAKKMDGGICFNEWLIEKAISPWPAIPTSRRPSTRSMIDWSKTKAWGDGGYYGRLFLNVQGREPQGIIAPEDYERVRRTHRPDRRYHRLPRAQPWLAGYRPRNCTAR